MRIKLSMLEGDIVRAMKNNKYSPLQVVSANYFKENIDNIEITYDSVIIWNDEINDYSSYKYCVEDIETVKHFLDEWNDYVSGHTDEFVANPIYFCVEEKI